MSSQQLCDCKPHLYTCKLGTVGFHGAQSQTAILGQTPILVIPQEPAEPSHSLDPLTDQQQRSPLVYLSTGRDMVGPVRGSQ